jgi:PAS domain S-box-containing protein
LGDPPHLDNGERVARDDSVSRPRPALPRLRFSIPPEASRLLRARERIRDYLRLNSRDDEAIAAVVLAVEEACTNAIVHSASTDDLVISMRFDGVDLHVCVKDGGSGFDAAAFDAHAVPDPLATGGRGLFLMARLMDELAFADGGGFEVHMSKRLPVRSAGDYEARVASGAAALPESPYCEELPIRLPAFLELIGEGFYALDWEYRLLYVNPEGARLIGKPKEDMLGRTPWEILPQLAGGATESAHRETMELGLPRRVQARARGRWLESRLYPTPAGMSVYFEDVTARRKLQREREELYERLARSEQRFRATFEQAAVGIVHADTHGRFLLANEGFARITGYSPQELTGMVLADVTWPDDLEASLANVRALVDGRIDSFGMEKRYVRKDGGVIWASTAVSASRAADGSPEYLIAVVQDISARKRAEQREAASEANAARLLASMSDGFFTVDRDWRYTYMNERALEIHRHSMEELLGRRMLDVFPDIKGSAFHRCYLAAMDERRPAAAEDFYADFDAWYEVRAYPIDEGIAVYVREVTERKRAELEREALIESLEAERRRLGLVMEQGSVGLAYLAPDFTILLVNSLFAEYTGLSREQLVGHGLFEAMPSAEAQSLFEQAGASGEAVEAKRMPYVYELQPWWGTVYYDWRLVPLGPGAQLEGFVLTVMRQEQTPERREG